MKKFNIFWLFLLFEAILSQTIWIPCSRASYEFFLSGEEQKNFKGALELVQNPEDIDQEKAKSILVESFIREYSTYLKPDEIGVGLTSWRDGPTSVEKYYEDYFHTEFEDFLKGTLHYWVQATVDGELVGWGTFQREKGKENEIYMNLLAVLPEYQGRGIGKQLVHSLSSLGELPDLNAIHLLLRKKNRGGRTFYSKLGFFFDEHYQREDNFVDLNLLESWTWKRSSSNGRLEEK